MTDVNLNLGNGSGNGSGSGMGEIDSWIENLFQKKKLDEEQVISDPIVTRILSIRIRGAGRGELVFASAFILGASASPSTVLKL